MTDKELRTLKTGTKLEVTLSDGSSYKGTFEGTELASNLDLIYIMKDFERYDRDGKLAYTGKTAHFSKDELLIGGNLTNTINQEWSIGTEKELKTGDWFKFNHNDYFMYHVRDINFPRRTLTIDRYKETEDGIKDYGKDEEKTYEELITAMKGNTILIREISPLIQLDEPEPACTCPIMQGCRCGAFETEMKTKYGSDWKRVGFG